MPRILGNGAGKEPCDPDLPKPTCPEAPCYPVFSGSHGNQSTGQDLLLFLEEKGRAEFED